MKIKIRFAHLFAAFFIAASSAAAFGQSPERAPEKLPTADAKLASKLMARDMPYRVIVPAGYSSGATRYPVIFLLHGLGGHYSNWTDKTDLQTYAAQHSYIIVMPEGDDGWYTDDPTKPTDAYESYIIKELVPEIDKKYRTVPDRAHRLIAGLSMGGFGAVKFGIKYPDLFVLVGSFSGAVAAASYRTADDLPAGPIRTGLTALFGEPGSDTKKANDIFAQLKDASPEKVASLPYIYMSCGTEDFLYSTNRDLMAILNAKKIPHEYREHPGVHSWTFWDDQAREFLSVADRYLAAKK